MRTEPQAQNYVDTLDNLESQLRRGARPGRTYILSTVVGLVLAMVVVTLMMLNPVRVAGDEQES